LRTLESLVSKEKEAKESRFQEIRNGEGTRAQKTAKKERLETRLQNIDEDLGTLNELYKALYAVRLDGTNCDDYLRLARGVRGSSKGSIETAGLSTNTAHKITKNDFASMVLFSIERACIREEIGESGNTEIARRNAALADGQMILNVFITLLKDQEQEAGRLLAQPIAPQ